MKTGILERILIRRFGEPVVAIMDGLHAHCWNPDEFDYATCLYMGMKWEGLPGLRFGPLKEIYGNAFGGYLIKNTLKAAILHPREIYGIWNIDDLRMQPEVQHALVRDPAIDYFMEASNVWFYGIKAGDLYVFDAEMDELDLLGPIEPALEILMDEWEAAGQDLPDS